MIRNYRNTIIVNFDKDCDVSKKWNSIISFLRKRGFSITENPTYIEHYKCLSKNNKIGYKNDVAILLERSIEDNSHNKFLKLQFGSVKNLWKDMKQSFWDNPKDNRYTQLSYLENKAVELEIFKTIKYCEKNWELKLKPDDSALSAEQFILNKLRENKHIHGDVKTLNGIKLSIESGVGKHNQGYNSKDKNGKKIICGDKKFFYDYNTKRLFFGYAWHNINNMWWVILPKGKFTNISASELFDFDASLPARQKVGLGKLNSILTSFEKKRCYKICIAIEKYASRIGYNLNSPE